MDFLPFAKLSKAPLSPRVRSVLESAYQLLWRESEPAVKAALDDFERELFRSAEKAQTNDAQNRLFEALKESRKKNSQVLTRYRDAIQGASLELLKPRLAVTEAPKKSNALSLVENAALEEDLAVSEIAARAEIKCTQQLTYLSVRYAVVTGGAPVPVDLVPCGPQVVMRAMAVGSQILEIPVQLRVDLLRAFERSFMIKLPDLLDKINDQMREQRVFAHLNLGLNRRAGSEHKADAKSEPKPEKKEALEALPEIPIETEQSAPTPAAARPLQSASFLPQPAASQQQTSPRPQPTSPLPSQTYATPPEDFGFGAVFDTGSFGDAMAETDFDVFGDIPPLPMSPNPIKMPPQRSAAAPAARANFDTPQRAPAAQPPASTRHGFSGLPSAAPQRPANQAPNQATPPQPAANNAQRASAPANDIDADLFSTLRELLGGRRGASSAASGEEGAAGTASAQDVQSVLTVLQSQSPTPVMAGGKWVPRRVTHIKQDMQNQLRQLNGGKPIKLAEEDNDTVDLVGMLFDHLVQDIKPSESSHTLINKLQVPVMKVALQDKSFFSRRNHPARQLLNSISETSLFWMEDEVDQPLLERMHMVVDRIISEYDQDHSIFESMLGDLNRHVNTLQRKAEVSEKRYVEAARGRERLDVARQVATTEIEKQTRGKMLPSLVLHLLEGAWTDVLALTQLREGVESEDFQERLQAAEQLSRCFDLDNPVSKSDYQDVKPVLEEGMGLVGFHQEEIDRTLKAVEELVVEGEAILPTLEPNEERAVTELVKSKATRVGAEREDKTPEAGESVLDAIQQERQTLLSHLRHKDSKMPLTPKEQMMLEKIKQLPFGTWFEFTVNQQGEKTRRKLSWFSPVTSRCLFVNARGAKAEERSLEQLARDLVRGNAAIWQENDESLIDRAWRSIKETLKGITGRSDSNDGLANATA
jgi:hypothetical protein